MNREREVGWIRRLPERPGRKLQTNEAPRFQLIYSKAKTRYRLHLLLIGAVEIPSRGSDIRMTNQTGLLQLSHTSFGVKVEDNTQA